MCQKQTERREAAKYSETTISYISLWLYSPLDLDRFFQFLNLYRVSRTSWTEDQSLPTHKTTQT
jgi:hypothetical protein